MRNLRHRNTQAVNLLNVPCKKDGTAATPLSASAKNLTAALAVCQHPGCFFQPRGFGIDTSGKKPLRR